MMKLVHIRYKDGRDKVIQMSHEFAPTLPYLMTRSIPHYPPMNNNIIANPTPHLESTTELIPMMPIQIFEDAQNNKHFICMDEILDITVEDIDEQS